MSNQKYLYSLHEDHNEWLKGLAFYAEDLGVLQHRLSEVSAKNTDHDMKMSVEKFQNQFYIQKNELDFLKHDINQAEHKIIEEIKHNPVAADHRKVADDEALRDRYTTFEKLYAELKEEFNSFASKYM